MSPRPRPVPHRTTLARLALAAVLAVGAAALTACSSDDGPDESTYVTAQATQPSSSAAASASAPAGSTGTKAPAGSETRTVCTKVTGIITAGSKRAISTLTKALQSGDRTKTQQAYGQVKTIYRETAGKLRTTATTVKDPSLKKQVQNAAGYFERAASNPTSSSSGADNSLSVLSKTCA